jgi:hypothetical protein
VTQLPEVGTVCGKAARTGLCEGREVTRVPTATSPFEGVGENEIASRASNTENLQSQVTKTARNDPRLVR